ncbi:MULTISPECIES: prephenate dehydrogenase [unclassified Luteococcus]|uniref:prephenate dehydrogenase n=1 Tax=unclassified Luteococcus TaxID=2639923 RepID=UPI00313C4952
MSQTPTTGELGPVVVIGAGLIGASIGMALTRAGERVHLVDASNIHAVVAAGLGAGLVEFPRTEEIRLVVVATPPSAVVQEVLEALELSPAAVVTDVASVKGRVLAELQTSGVDLSRYVGSHPMAGSQHAGPLTASADLFLDRTWVVCPRPENSSEDVQRVRELALLCGARTVEMDALDHDEAVAQVSHLPQLMSTLTAQQLRGVDPTHLQLAGQGVRDVTRIAASDPVMWRQIITANAGAVRHELERVRRGLDELFEVLDQPDALEAFMARGRTAVKLLPGKHGAHPVDWEAVVVEIPDAPGALARLFVDIGEEGVNVEDLSIEHDETREVGFLSVEVSPAQAARLREAMVSKGWSLRP